MEIVFAIVMGAVGVTAAGLGVVSYRAKRKQRHQVWKQVAESRGGTFHPHTGFFPGEPSISVGSVHVDTFSTGTGESQTYYTRWASRFPQPTCRFKIYREGFFSKVGKALGTQDVILGQNRSFDDHFMVKCDNAAITRAAWNPQAQNELLTLAHASAECDGSGVELQLEGLANDARVLNTGIDVLESLVQHDVFGAEPLRAVAGTLRIDNKLPFAEVSLPRRVELATVELDGRLTSRATLMEPLTAEDQRFHFGNDDARDLPHAAKQYADILSGGILVVANGRAHIHWPEIVRDAEALAGAARLLGALATVAEGPYR
jgi:hypothetical protein